MFHFLLLLFGVLENDVLVLLEEGAPKKIQLDVVKGCMAS
jgi:hypothetical protein